MKPTDLPSLRRSLGVTQAPLGAMLGVHEQTVSKWERGETAPPAYNEQQIEWLYHGAGNIGAAERAALKNMLRHGLGVPALALLVQRGMVAATVTPPPEVLPHPSQR